MAEKKGKERKWKTRENNMREGNKTRHINKTEEALYRNGD